MKLADHVDHLRRLISKAFDKELFRLGIGTAARRALDELPSALQAKKRHFKELLDSHEGETGSYVSAREKALDELTFTLFNRIAAIKVMEAAVLFAPIITKQAEHGDRSFGHKAWLEDRPDMRHEELEGIREYIKHAFSELEQTLPLFSKEHPYASLPDPISLDEIIEAFNAVEIDPQIDDDIWQSDDILGWLYESYNNARKQIFKQKRKDSKAKVEYDKVSLQSQIYTPRWVVQFLVDNSLGKLYLEMYPDSIIKNRFKIANPPDSVVRERKPLHEIKMIDPAAGSGNFLLYAFDFFYELYLDQIENYGADYDEDDIPRLIIENNIHGIDLDDRAIQLAQLGLYIKARKKQRRIGSQDFNVVSSDFFLPDYSEVRHIFEENTKLDGSQNALIENIWTDLQYAYKFGSLIRISEKLKAKVQLLYEKEILGESDLDTGTKLTEHEKFVKVFFENLRAAVDQYAKQQGNSFLCNKARDAVTFLGVVTSKYDIVTTNPPYTDSADFGPNLKHFIETNYKKPYKFNTNLYATFIKRCYELTDKAGKISIIHPHTFMFIKTFEDVRKFIVDKTHIDVMVDFGLDRVNMFGPGILVDATFYVLSKSKSDLDGLYFNLSTNLQEKFKKGTFINALDNLITGNENERVYELAQSKLKIIKSWPFIYWISDEFRKKFKSYNFEYYFKLATGLMTGNNLKHLRFYWEVDPSQLSIDYPADRKKWVPYQKGGDFKKWYGNNWLVVNFVENGKLLATTDNKAFYFQDGITYSATSSKGTSFRKLPCNQVFDKKGSCIFSLPGKNLWDLDYVLAVLNSKLNFYIINCLNSTVETQVGDVKRVPFITPAKSVEKKVANLAKVSIDIKKILYKYSYVEKEFTTSPLRQAQFGVDYKPAIKSFFNYENHLNAQILLNEAIINDKIFEVYELTESDKEIVLSKEGESIGCLPVSEKAREAYLVENEATKKFPLENIRDFIESLPVKKIPSEEREAIEDGFPSLYQGNNNLEEFCIRNQVNPINVWYWFKQSNVIPKQRMNDLAMEFLADMIREILMEDEDGIIPLVANAGETILLERLEEKFLEKGFSSAQFSSFDSVLGRELNDYLNNYFFQDLSDYLNLFMYLPKTPFIWHLSSGPEHGFDCYIIIYKWSRDKLMRMKSVYLERRERALVNRQSDLANNESATAQNEKDMIFKQLKEIETFRRKIDELLEEGYNPILDDGVGKNIAPLQKKKMIPYDVLTPGQLNKYLNADW